jgi:hypothetical protein
MTMIQQAKTTGQTTTITGKKNNTVDSIQVSVIRFKKPPVKPAAFVCIEVILKLCAKIYLQTHFRDAVHLLFYLVHMAILIL